MARYAGRKEHIFKALKKISRETLLAEMERRATKPAAQPLTPPSIEQQMLVENILANEPFYSGNLRKMTEGI
jgi:hypothetical protein